MQITAVIMACLAETNFRCLFEMVVSIESPALYKVHYTLGINRGARLTELHQLLKRKLANAKRFAIAG